MNSRWLTIAEAAKYLSASTSTVKRLIAGEYLHWHELGGLKRLDREEIDGMFKKPETTERRGTVSDDEFRRFVRE